MKKNDKRTLRLHTTTVRALGAELARGVAGGYSGNDKSCGANSCREPSGGGGCGGGTDLM